MHTSADQLFSKRSEEKKDKGQDSAYCETACTAIHMQGVQYCEETTLHGFQYLTHPGVATKIGWLVVVVLSVTASVVFMVMNVKEYLQVGTKDLCTPISKLYL